jgi:nucleoside-diphosphate-sugar epimerase
MKKVLLTGATGFVGRHAIAPLQSLGFEIHAISSHGIPEWSKDIYWHQIDLLDPIQSNGVIQQIRPTHLLHLAWYVTHGKFWNAVENLTWVQASLSLLRSFAEAGGQRVVMAGTCAEYDWTSASEILSEESSPMKPITLYGSCKHALQIMLAAFANQNKLSAAWGRIFFLYGPHEHPNRLVPSVINSLLSNQPAYCSHGKQVRDFLYVTDVAEAFVALLDTEVQGPINIASGQPVTLSEVIDRVAVHLNLQHFVQYGAIPSPPNEPPAIVADTRTIQNEVKWSPKVDLDSGLIKAVKWWSDQK